MHENEWMILKLDITNISAMLKSGATVFCGQINRNVFLNFKKLVIQYFSFRRRSKYFLSDNF
jgi:hypothetical protein